MILISRPDGHEIHPCIKIRCSHAVILVVRRLKAEINDRQSNGLACPSEDSTIREMRTEVSAVLGMRDEVSAGTDLEI